MATNGQRLEVTLTHPAAAYAAIARASDGLKQLDTSRKLAIIVGSEWRGVRDIVKKGADFIVDIPMRGKVGSLNVSVAAAVALFEIARRRSTASTQPQKEV